MSDVAATYAAAGSFDCPLIEVAGSPRERGRQYGEQAAIRIKRGIEHYSAQLDVNLLGWPRVRQIAASFEPTIAAFEQSYVDEMRGIADGAGVEYAAIVLLNARTEILKLAERRDGVEASLSPDGCTGIVVLPEAAAARQIVHAQNWDWKVECAATAVMLKVHRDDGPDLLTFTEAGGLARSGFNAAGISITANYLKCDRDYLQTGVPLALLRRKVLEQTDVALAMRIVSGTPKSAANNMTVAHTSGIAINFECAPDETFPVRAERGVIVHANHFQSPVALASLKDVGFSRESQYRDQRVRSLVEPYLGFLTRHHVKAALFDYRDASRSVCKPPRRNSSQTVSASVAMIVMEPHRGSMEVTMLPALNRTGIQFELEMQSN